MVPGKTGRFRSLSGGAFNTESEAAEEDEEREADTARGIQPVSDADNTSDFYDESNPALAVVVPAALTASRCPCVGCWLAHAACRASTLHAAPHRPRCGAFFRDAS